MNRRAIIARETAISIAINVVLSIAFFMLVFGLGTPVRLGDMATDFLPQTFMIALMGSLVPPLLLRRKVGSAARPMVARALLIAFVALATGGGAAYLVCTRTPDLALAAATALSLRAVYGAVLALIVTPIAMFMLLNASTESIR